MENLFLEIRILAKSVRYQNLFSASKEIGSIRIFKNTYDFSKLQEFFLSYLYTYDMINKDIARDEVSEKVLDCELFTDAYLLWKRKNKSKKDNKEIKNKQRKLSLVAGKEIKFPKR